MYDPVLLLSLVPLIAAQSCQPNGTWSAWYLSGTQPNGYDYCGACLNANFSRTCETNAAPCPCVGINTQFANTNTEPCLPPREPCCPGFTVQADGNCGPISPALAPDPTPPNPPPVNGTSCTAARYWGAWGPWSACNSSCGACGVSQRIRPCASVAWGCPCPSTATSPSCQTKACGEPVCTSGPPCCGNATVTVGYDGTEYCNPFAAKILAAGGNLTCDGSWTEWADARGATCNATCGLCGLVEEERLCMPSGCTCEAAERTRTVPCTATPCPAPNECCDPYEVRILANGTAVCDLPCVSTWSQWYPSPNQTSWDICGGCFEEQFYRICLSNDTCPCKGPDTFSAPGNTQVCYLPRLSCCGNLTDAIINGMHACGPEVPFPPDPAPPSFNATACPECKGPAGRKSGYSDGYWSRWSIWGSCEGNITCGMCGTATRNRTCISKAWNCSCCDEATETQPCGNALCTTGDPCCNGSYETTLFDGLVVCNPLTDLSCTGAWTEWTANGVCSASCGACGSKMEKRECWPSGCHCDGPFNRSSPCNAQPCPAPSQPCCPTYGVYTDPATGINSCATCNSSYLWAEWTDAPGAVCADYCGSCATINQVRKCASGCCPANGQTTQTVPCGLSVCLYPRASCCAPYKKVIFNSTFICGLDPTTTTGVPTTTTTTPPPPCPPDGGIWSVWSLALNQNGFDVCGSCWLANYVRTCLDGATCPCVGSNTAQASANVDVCLYPRYSCCPGKTKQIVNGTFVCGPLTLLPPDSTPLTCTQYGAWGGWNSWSTCSATCGMCGVRQRNRTCTSAPGCPCKNPVIDKYQTESCGGYLCPTGFPCCNGFALVKGYDGYTYCGTSTVAPVCTGTWSAWYGANENYPNTTTCTDSCGNCGLIAQYRFCYPSGCQCPGSHWQNVACGNTVCLYPRQSCCTPYKKSISGSTFICG